ncbi:1,3-beta-glucan synthase component FKS1 [Smittium mucronatum]|uniref:1,3-beta-glucan synthase n=1 Tax=Smittium mucronatum TaxID=133383 RepID=A0A1R0GYN0_9FUNG|nr:1,3-beta-glucan synthase component FKS1 [Smittium mucronatum]
MSNQDHNRDPYTGRMYGDEEESYIHDYEDNDPYGVMGYEEYGGQESFDASYYDNANDNYAEPAYYQSDVHDRSQYDSNPSGRRRRGNKRGGMDSDVESMSDGAFSIRSSLVRTPASHTSAADIDIFGEYRTKGNNSGRYANYAPSTDSLMNLIENKKTYRPTGSVTSFSQSASWVSNNDRSGMDFAQAELILNDSPYPSWSDPNQIPLSKEEIEDIFKDLTNKLGFQKDSMKNVYDMMMIMLDSRASRMSPLMALLTLHSDYIGGDHANYRRWYFSAQLDHDTPAVRQAANNKATGEEQVDAVDEVDNLSSFVENWRSNMNSLSQYDRARQIALYLLIWGEAGNIRFTGELVAFLFKIAEDYYKSPACQQKVEPEREGYYLECIITPIYNFLRDEGYQLINGKYFKRDQDHDTTIGYDDLNETFWTPEGLRQLVFDDKSSLMDLPPEDRYHMMKDVNYKKSIRKTYKEKRSMGHLITNFSRIWILHVVVYWYYIVFVADFLYDNQFELRSSSNPSSVVKSVPVLLPDIAPRRFSLLAAGGGIAPFIAIVGAIFELGYVRFNKNNFRILMNRIMVLLIFLLVDVVPIFFCWNKGEDPTFSYVQSDENKFVWTATKLTGDDLAAVSSQYNTFRIAKIVAIIQFIFSIFVTVYLSIAAPGYSFQRQGKKRSSQGLVNRTFTANFPPLSRSSRATSFSLWFMIFMCKYIESYFFLARSFKDPFKWLYQYTSINCNEKFIGSKLCSHQNYITLGLMLLLDLLLFFLDTYLWYVIWNTVFSVGRSFYMGISIWTPWRNIFSRLPKRIYTKILATADMEVKYKPKVLCSQIWNAIIISMYREHLLSIEHVQKLLYQQVPSDENGRRTLKPPTFFVAQDDASFDQEFYPPHSEAERRISFFAQSLSTVLPEPIPVENMPTFTVLTPHYGEKILLSLREIIRESDRYSRVTVLEYLKALQPDEWDNFVKDTKILAEESAGLDNNSTSRAFEEKGDTKVKADDLPFYSVGFKSASPEFTLRTRIWASLRSQTLYRTISGFMNYAKAIKLLYRVENPEMVLLFGGNGSAKLERELERMANRKFRFVVAMQRFMKFTKEEHEATDFLLRTYPSLQIAYLDEEQSPDGTSSKIYSCLVDGRSEILEDGSRRPHYRIQLPGNPILGDGKSDNQNHASVFVRGEYVQMIDANQDNYLEECLKIRNVLGEFEEYNPPTVSPYSPASEPQGPPVAIVGAREYIFSESVGVLGDVAAGKEATFGTLTQRMMAEIGGRLHYGHPDFINFVFMTTRGGFSKAQKGLHLNEDIYAGMNAFSRGGRIKHTEYIQCGKGRDLGFCSTLNFITKIGTGMGEQMLSREYYWLGCFLPLDRFLTFYYAHPGFHVNNLMIMATVQIFMLSVMFVATMNITLNICPHVDMNDPNYYKSILAQNCFMLQPVSGWINRTTLAILVVLLIAFLPLFLQMLTEQGFVRAVTRLGKQFMSLSPIYEVQVTQVYAYSISSNLSFGGARYIGTGRGFATSRLTFATLYSRFSEASIYLGARLMMILTFITLTMWQWPLIYFWLSIAALIISPFIYNPHQFVRTDFILDYRDWLRWLCAGNTTQESNSWISHCRLSRIRVTGYKRKRLGERTPSTGYVPRAKKSVIVFSEIFMPIISAVIVIVAYIFTCSRWGVPLYTGDTTTSSDGSVTYPTVDSDPVPDNQSSIFTAFVISLIPVAINAGMTFFFFAFAFFLGPLMSSCLPGFGKAMATTCHLLSVLIQIVVYYLSCIVEGWDTSRAFLCMIVTVFVQRAFFSILLSLLLTREFGEDETNIAWWTGRWYDKGMGAWVPTLILREWLCKIIESSIFVCDFLVGHAIFFFLSVFTLIPWIDKWHSTMIFWLRPSRQIRPPIYSLKQRKQRSKVSLGYGILLGFAFVIFVALVTVPYVKPITDSISVPETIVKLLRLNN